MTVPLYSWLGLLTLAASAIGIWWARTRQQSAQREAMRAFYKLSEEIFAARSSAEIAERLTETLPSIMRVHCVRLYLCNLRTKSLESVPVFSDPDPMAVSLEGLAEGLSAGAVRCFHDRSLIYIPDVRRDPLVNAGWKSGLPHSAMFAPLLAQLDVLGVIETSSNRRAGYFSSEEQATLQHLANQVAASLKLEEQQAMREQVFRSEKLAATGQLISGVASDLRAPLDKIEELSASLAGADNSSQIERTLKQLTAEAQRASEIVSRLVSFARPAETGAQLLDLNALAGNLLRFREPEWQTLGLRVQNRLSPVPAMVLGVEGQIEEILLSLLVSAEKSAARSAAKTLEITSSLIASRVVVEIHYSEDSVHVGPKLDEPNLEVCRAIAQNHGGELRFRNGAAVNSFDVDLPLTPPEDRQPAEGNPARPRRTLTLMLVEADPGAQRQLLGLLSSRGHRVVPMRGEEAADVAQRFRFDAVIWAVQRGASPWSNYHERLRESVPTFVLVSDGYDPQLAASLQESGGLLLGRPLEESELDRVLEAVEVRSAVRA